MVDAHSGPERRRGLAVVRCGDRSLHREWAATTTGFDVAVSYFGSDEAATFPEARYVHRFKGGKWDGIFAFFEANPELIDAYDYFWLPDDDLSLPGESADALPAAGIAHGLELWQPALDDKSYYGHLITLAVPGLALRFTNFVEIMAPALSARLLKDTLHLFAATRSGFGLDYLWPQRAQVLSGSSKPVCAILDCIRITHTRPLGLALRSTIVAGGGLTLREEYAAILKLVSKRNPLFRSMMLAVPRKLNLSGIDRDGQHTSGFAMRIKAARTLGDRTLDRVQSIGWWDLFRYLATSFA